MFASQFSLPCFLDHSFSLHNFHHSTSLSIMPCSTVSFLASNTRPPAFFAVRIACPMLKSPHPSGPSLIRHSLCDLKKNRWQTASLSNPSSNFRTSCLPLVQSYLHILILVQFADQLSFAPLTPVSPWICSNLVQFTWRKSSVRLWGKHTIFHLQVYPQIILVLFSTFKLHPFFLFLF